MEGTPEQVAHEPRSYTGQHLEPLLRGALVELQVTHPRKKRASPLLHESPK